MCPNLALVTSRLSSHTTLTSKVASAGKVCLADVSILCGDAVLLGGEARHPDLVGQPVILRTPATHDEPVR